MACNCNPFKRMIEANFAKAAQKKDPEKELERKLIEKEKAKAKEKK